MVVSENIFSVYSHGQWKILLLYSLKTGLSRVCRKKEGRSKRNIQKSVDNFAGMVYNIEATSVKSKIPSGVNPEDGRLCGWNDL